MKKIFFIVFLTGVFQINAQEQLLIRDSYLLHLAIDNETYWEFDGPEIPYVFEKETIQLFPGEIVNFELIETENEKILLKAVKEVTDEENTIIVDFKQIVKDEDTREHNFMMLTVMNPFNRTIVYKAKIFLILYEKWVDTTIIPVREYLSSYEMWPDVIGTIVLYDFMYAD
ncbi:hypothetical protein [Breznakiella homolactica]|uniref:Uncharacterized protein n=1 Tax=Breznakiella homolactica TaxID=2798577 RepID=A0A7T7XQ81_9SPIR|nr:hypothetical protein [Breznakiella homolactica]QQO10387.1 hypothetical protein JFL75_05565 [Breznakiella homolactica]